LLVIGCHCCWLLVFGCWLLVVIVVIVVRLQDDPTGFSPVGSGVSGFYFVVVIVVIVSSSEVLT